jgi:hypothetical protein
MLDGALCGGALDGGTLNGGMLVDGALFHRATLLTVVTRLSLDAAVITAASTEPSIERPKRRYTSYTHLGVWR